MVCSQAPNGIVGTRSAACQRPVGEDETGAEAVTVHVVEKPAEWDPPDAFINCLWMTGYSEVNFWIADNTSGM